MKYVGMEGLGPDRYAEGAAPAIPNRAAGRKLRSAYPVKRKERGNKTMNRHSKKNRLAALLLALAICLTLSACDSGAAKAPETMEEIMEKAQENMEAAESISYEMIMNIGMAVEGKTFQMSMLGKGEMIQDPMLLKMDININLGGFGSMDTILYAAMEDGQYMTYTGADMGSGLVWQKQAVTSKDELAQYNVTAMSLYMEQAVNYQENGTEMITGVEVTRYDGMIPNEYMNEVMLQTGMLEQFDSLGMPAEDIQALFSDLGEIPISVWINKENCLLVKCEIDMTEVVQKLMVRLMEAVEGGEEVEMAFTKVAISMVITGVNNVESIEIPAEALAA